ncbi:MAG: RnfABCDGE type electron transport complex subunit B [Candidatus Omnitrophota bacterium]|nr:RnfABCDGE type electron transport complex subunit B [Candidatus Omnitrophota bacterium]
MFEIIVPVLTLSGLGLIFGIGLAIAAKKLCVATDPRIDEVFSNLPGTNCGACGMAGCMGFAEGLIQGTCTIEKCPVTELQKKIEIAGLLGQEVKQKVKTIAVLHCGGGKRAKHKFKYDGVKDCIAANLILGGHKACVYGCLGFATCVRACPFGAITMGGDELPIVNEEKCTACGKCVAICPKKLFSLAPIGKKFYTNCASLDFGKAVLEVCPLGCIACGKCEKVCPVSAIKVVDNLAIFDYEKCQNIGECLKVCPTKCIVKRSNEDITYGTRSAT